MTEYVSSSMPSFANVDPLCLEGAGTLKRVFVKQSLQTSGEENFTIVQLQARLFQDIA
jgi:hypothetical protein